MKTYHSFSSADTKALAAGIAAQLVAEIEAAHGAQVVALYGDLGAGKTTFVQGFLRALGVRGRVTSPTFVLMKRFAIPARARKKRTAIFEQAYHIDAYRFRAATEADALGLKEILKDPQAIVLVEWPERLKGFLPRGMRNKMIIRFKHGKREDERDIIIA